MNSVLIDIVQLDYLSIDWVLPEGTLNENLRYAQEFPNLAEGGYESTVFLRSYVEVLISVAIGLVGVLMAGLCRLFAGKVRPHKYKCVGLPPVLV